MNYIKCKRNSDNVVRNEIKIVRRAAVCDEISLQKTLNVSVVAANAGRIAE